MPTVPRYEGGQVGGVRPLPDASISVRPQPVGDNFFSIAGEAIQGFLDNAAEEQKKLQDQIRKINTRKAIFEYEKSQTDILSEFDVLESDAVLESAPEVLANLNQIKENIIQNAQDVDIGALEIGIGRADIISYKAFSKKVASARLNSDKNIMNGRIELAIHNAITDASNLPQALATIQDETIDFSSRYLGLDADSPQVQNSIRSINDDLIEQVANNAFSTGDLEIIDILLSNDMDISASVRNSIADKYEEAGTEATANTLAVQAYFQNKEDPEGALRFIEENVQNIDQLFPALEAFNKLGNIQDNVTQRAKQREDLYRKQKEREEAENEKRITDEIYMGLRSGEIEPNWTAIDQAYPPGTLSEKQRDNIHQYLRRQFDDKFLPSHPSYQKYSEWMTNSSALNAASDEEFNKVISGIPIRFADKLVFQRSQIRERQEAFLRDSIGKRVKSRLDALGLSGIHRAKERGRLTDLVYDKFADPKFDLNDTNAVNAVLDEVLTQENVRAEIADVKAENNNPAFAPTVTQFLRENLNALEIDDTQIRGTASSMLQEELAATVSGKPTLAAMNKIFAGIMEDTYPIGIFGINYTLAEIYADASRKEIRRAKEELADRGVSNPTKAVIAKYLAGAYDE